ncbi:MAG TPA: DUF4129 domain-containing protein, partial [Pseudomonadales bacterium]|nr:DUF4129 domain-containing protein [Pseudomonadales bacterium]
NHQGADSPFFRIQFALEHAGLNRDPGESLSAWLVRIDQTELLPILSLHNRLRFDPRGLAADQAKQLNQQVDRWLEVGSIH